MKSADIFSSWQPWQVALAETVAAEMVRFGLSPEEMIALAREYMTAQVDAAGEEAREAARAHLETHRAAAVPGAEPYRAPRPPARRGVTPQAGTPADMRRRADQADAEYRLGACPLCGGEVWGIKKCPHISPPWRAFFACDNEECAYHGRSRLPVDELRRRWPEGAEVD